MNEMDLIKSLSSEPVLTADDLERHPAACLVVKRTNYLPETAATEHFVYFVAALTCTSYACAVNNCHLQQEITIWEEPRRHPSWQRITTPQIPIGYNGMPHIYLQNCSSPSTISTPSNSLHSSRGRPHSPPKRHPDPISRFATVHPPDRPTDRQTDT